MKDFIYDIIKKVGAYQMEFLNKKVAQKTKDNLSLVSEVDENSEKMIIDAVLARFPESSIIGEESGETNIKETKYQWIIDPLDGTTNYLHGMPLFAVSIGVRKEGELKYAAIYCPALDELYYAERGRGAFLNDKPISVSMHDEFKNGLFGTGFYYTAKKDEVSRLLERFTRVQVASLGVRRPGAAAIDLAWVACGRYDGYWELGVHCWDVAAGVLLVEEAGGKVTRIDGSDHDIFGRNILASNGRLHLAMIDILNV